MADTPTPAPASLPDDLPVLPFADDAAFEAWLCAHASSKGLWLKIAKKDSGIATVTYGRTRSNTETSNTWSNDVTENVQKTSNISADERKEKNNHAASGKQSRVL